MPLTVESVDLMPVIAELVEELFAGRKPDVQRLTRQVTRSAAAQMPTQASGAGLGVLGGVLGGIALVAKPRISRAERRRLARLEREVNRAD